MPGTVSTPSGDGTARASIQGEEVYDCSHCKQIIPLPSDQKIQSICSVVQSHLEKCMPPSIFQGNLSNLQLFPQKFPPLADACMPLQPRRTWSAEDERRRRLEEDPDAYDVGPHTVTCAGCHRPIRLNATGRYYAANWNKHKMGCKNTNTVNGASAISAESKFTGRVAAFRVAKPAEISEAFILAGEPNISASQESRHLRADSSRPPYPRPASEERMISCADQLPSKGQSAVRQYEAAPGSLPCPRAEMSTRASNDCSMVASVDRAASARAHSDTPNVLDSEGLVSSAHLGNYRLSRSPKGPLSRFEDREAYGPTRAPFRGEFEGYKQSSHAIPPVGPLRPREEPSPQQHSGDALRHAAYPLPSEPLPKFQRVLDKGKARHIEPSFNPPHILQRSPSHKHVYLDAALVRRNTLNKHARVYDRTTILDSCASQGDASGFGRQADRPRIQAERGLVSDFSSDSAASSPEFRVTRLGRSLSTTTSILSDSRPQTHSRFDERALPPLSSLTLANGTDPTSSSGAAREKLYRHNTQSKERHDSLSFDISLYRSSVWQERTRAWVRAGTAWSASDRDSPESVVLPPIRTTLNPPPTNPSGTRRRQREADDHDANSMGEDRPSPPKVFVVPMDSSHSSSTLRADDLSLKYKPTSASSDEDTNVGGDLKRNPFVGNQPEPGANLTKGAQGSLARLHPVWKWEQAEDVRQSSGTNRDSDIVMSLN